MLDRLQDISFNLKPCGEALRQLHSAIMGFHGLSVNEDSMPLLSPEQREANLGKDWEKVTAASVLLFARSNARFSPSTWCSPPYCGKGLSRVLLRGGPSVVYKELPETVKFPASGAVTSQELEQLATEVEAVSVGGMIMMPTHRFNECGDSFGFFKKANGSPYQYALLVFQNKNWFKESLFKSGPSLRIADSWRKRRHLSFPNSVEHFTDKQGNLCTVEVIHILASVNDQVLEEVHCQANEGVLTVKSMRSWLPTAAFACETANLLRVLFDASGNAASVDA
jgi:hypothetical protein